MFNNNYCKFYIDGELAQNTINEDFESGALHPLMTLTLSVIRPAPGIKANDSFGSREVFGFGKSNCSSSCFDSYKQR